MRALAYGRLRRLGRAVKVKELLGVVVEVGLAGGLDTLAAFSDGSVRYINASGAMALFEGDPAIAALAQKLIAACGPVVARTGPLDRPRLPPPEADRARITFLVSDGLYIGEGPMAALQKDGLAGPVIARATDLLLAVTSRPPGGA